MKKTQPLFRLFVILALVLMVGSGMLPGTGPESAYAAGETTDYRLAGVDRYETSLAIMDRLYQEEGPFQCVIVAYGQNFPDALAGGYLAMIKEAPIVLCDPAHESLILSRLRTVCNKEAEVYILGGTGVISESFESRARARGFRVKRLGGANRFATDLQILEEVKGTSQELLVADGYGFADSLSGSACGRPILLVGKSLTPEQKTYLSHARMRKIYILGGTGSVSAEVQKELAAYAPVERLGGANRNETSALIAKKFFPHATTVFLADSGNFPDGLSGAPLALKKKAPLLLVNNRTWQYAAGYVEEVGATTDYAIGGKAGVSDATVKLVMGTYTYKDLEDFLDKNPDVWQAIKAGADEASAEIRRETPSGEPVDSIRVRYQGHNLIYSYQLGEVIDPVDDEYVTDQLSGLIFSKELEKASGEMNVFLRTISGDEEAYVIWDLTDATGRAITFTEYI